MDSFDELFVSEEEHQDIQSVDHDVKIILDDKELSENNEEFK